MLHPPRYDAAIVLGAMVHPDGRPSAAMTRRVARACGLVRDGMVGQLLMSGGPVAHPIPEAHVMRGLALKEGLEPGRLLVEDRSRNTIENARLSAPLVAAEGWRSLLMVTDAYHVPRALYVFARFGLKVTAAAAWPERPGREWWAAWAREAAALPWTAIRVERTLRFRAE